MLEVTQRLGGQNYVLWGGREGYDTLLNTDLRREGQQLARFLHLVAEHKARIGFEGQLLIEPKPMEPTKHQYDYDTPVRARVPRPQRARRRVQGQHRGEPRDARGAQLPPRGGLRGRERHDGLHRRQPGRPPERLGHRPVPELGRGPGPAAVRDPAGRRHRARRLQLRRQAAPPEHRPHGPVPRPHRRPRHDRPGAARRGGPRGARRAGGEQGRPLRRLGRRAGRGDPRWRRRASPTSRRASPRASSIRGRCPGARSAWRTSSTGASGPSTARPGAEPMGVVLGIDVSTTATKAIVIDASGRVLGMASSEYPFEQPHPLWSEQHPRLWWDGHDRGDRGARWAQRASPGTTWPRWASPARCTASCCSTRPATSSGRRSCGTTSGPPPSATRSARRSARARLVEITGNDALTGFTAPKLLWVRDHEPEAWARVAHVLLPKDYVRYRLTGAFALDKADGAGTILFDLAARDWSPEVLDALGIDPAWMPPTYEGPEVTGTVTREAAAATGPPAGHARRRGRRGPGGERRRRRGGRARARRALARHVRRRVRHDRPADLRCGRPGARLLPRRPRPVAPDVGDAVGGGQPALVPGRHRAGRALRPARPALPAPCRRRATGCCSSRT